MTNSQRLATVRKRILSWITEVDSCQEHRIIERETTLIRDDFYVGRRFYTPTHRAVWFIEQDQLKIYDRDNQLVCVFDTAQIDQVNQPQDGAPDVIRLPASTDSMHDSGDDAGQNHRRAA